jgi:uncharacterized RmlC-like cupin family protein
MKLSVHRDHFRSPEQAYDEMEINGLYPVEMDVPAVKNESHWHEFSTWLYVLEGELHITDTAHDRILVAGPGSRVDVPERVLHSEESTGYKIIAGLSVNPGAITEPIDLAPELLQSG